MSPDWSSGWSNPGIWIAGPRETDRRVQVIRLTKAGRAEFRKMAAEHETWIADLFGDLNPKDVRELMRLLAKTKASAQKSAQARAL